MLFHLVRNHSVRGALVFTKSAESAGRLVRLFEFFETAFDGSKMESSGDVKREISVAAYSSDLPAGERKAILERFKAKSIDMYVFLSQSRYNTNKFDISLVCSDLISRGIDISHVEHVVSYDVPVDMRKYVHRVGRTARAGRKGDAWTLVEEQEVSFGVGVA
jgi:ATP-dependent RNA helicase DDX51/DBP6